MQIKAVEDTMVRIKDVLDKNQRTLDEQHGEIVRRAAILRQQEETIRELERLAKSQAEKIIESAKKEADEQAQKQILIAQMQIEPITKKFEDLRAQIDVKERELQAMQESLKKMKALKKEYKAELHALDDDLAQKTREIEKQIKTLENGIIADEKVTEEAQ